MKNKVVVIGLDGMDWRLLMPAIAAGELPTLARLVREGASGPLRSTIRPESSVAWSSFATGVNPGKHGVYGFVHHDTGTYDFRLANSTNIGVPKFWDILGDAGRKVGLINIPFTYPPSPVNGFLVSGMLTPGKHVDFTHPETLKKQLLTRFDGEYMFDASEGKYDKKRLLADVASYTQQQLETASWLMQEEAWDTFVVVFTGPDRLQHFFWADKMEQHSHHNSDGIYGSTLNDHFKCLDDAIAQILSHVPRESVVMLMSDHGFNGVGRRFYVNRWLVRAGYLSLNSMTTSFIGGFAAQGLSRMKEVPLLRQIKRSLLPTAWGPATFKTAVFTQPIDWKNTQVYYAPDGGLRINCKGREPEGIVPPGDPYESLCEELREKLLALTDIETGFHPVARVYKKEELYNGNYTNQAPDLILEPDRSAENDLANYLLEGSLDLDGSVFTTSDPYSGNHAQDGILIVWGSNIRPQKDMPTCQIIDIAPTLLAMQGVSIPDYMDGKFLDILFQPNQIPTATYITAVVPTRQVQANNSIDNNSVVEDRLRNLGYLD